MLHCQQKEHDQVVCLLKKRQEDKRNEREDIKIKKVDNVFKVKETDREHKEIAFMVGHYFENLENYWVLASRTTEYICFERETFKADLLFFKLAEKWELMQFTLLIWDET
jgi:hypothetical protein